MAARCRPSARLLALALAFVVGACAAGGREGSATTVSGPGSSVTATTTSSANTTTTTAAAAEPSRDRFAIVDLGGGRFTVSDRDGEPVEFGAEDRTSRPDGWPTDLDVLNVPGPSMQPTVPEDARLVVDQTAGVADLVVRGDVVLVAVTPDPGGREVVVVRRVVAVAGDRIGQAGEALTLDGTPLDEPYTDGTATRACGGGPDPLGFDSGSGLDVPEGQVVLLGDNRENSLDSRCYGPVDRTAIVGRGVHVVFPATATGPL